MTEQEYAGMVRRLVPKSPMRRNAAGAFLIGGAICTLGQVLMDLYRAAGIGKDEAGTAASMTLVVLSALLTGLSLYDDLAKIGGAGTLVPITGFANAIAAPAVEFRTDESDIIGLSQKAFKHLGASMMI